MTAIKYPAQIAFDSSHTICEQASLQSDGWVVWLSAFDKNTNKQSALYRIISIQQTDTADYVIALSVKGRWKNE